MSDQPKPIFELNVQDPSHCEGTLHGKSMWITANNIDVYVIRHPDAVEVQLHPAGNASGEPLDGALVMCAGAPDYAFDAAIAEAQAIVAKPEEEEVKGHTIEEWAEAIADRIVDECFGAIPVQDALKAMLVENPGVVKAMIGTPIIESEYFEPVEEK